MNYYTNKQLCEKYQISKPTASEYRKQGMPHIKLSERTIRYDIQEVEQWLKQKMKGENYNDNNM